MLKLKPLKDEMDWRELHALMVREDFPDTPRHFVEALPFLRSSVQLGGFTDEALQVAFVFGHLGQSSASLDVVCARGYRGRWATRRVLRHVYWAAFVAMPLKFLWAEARNRTACRACVRAGFSMVQPPEADEAFLILTREDAAQKLQISDEMHGEMMRGYQEKYS